MADPTAALTAARGIITDYVTADALAMIDTALAVRAPVPGMETTEEDRAGMLCLMMQPGQASGNGFTARLLRDHDRLSTEVTRLTAALAEAEITIGRLNSGAELQSLMRLNNELAALVNSREIAAREEEREWCAKIAAADKVPDCGLPRDYPVDKPCPQCGDLGTVGGFAGKCPGSAGNRIATTIRSQS